MFFPFCEIILILISFLYPAPGQMHLLEYSSFNQVKTDSLKATYINICTFHSHFYKSRMFGSSQLNRHPQGPKNNFVGKCLIQVKRSWTVWRKLEFEEKGGNINKSIPHQLTQLPPCLLKNIRYPFRDPSKLYYYAYKWKLHCMSSNPTTSFWLSGNCKNVWIFRKYKNIQPQCQLRKLWSGSGDSLIWWEPR